MAKTMSLRLQSLLLFIGVLIPSSLASSSAAVLQWSDKTYGPDGPWQAISVNIGTPSQAIDLLPGGVRTSNILSASVCSDITNCQAQTSGLFNTSSSTSYKQINSTGIITNSTFASQNGALPMLTGSAHTGLDTLTISTDGSSNETTNNIELLVIESAHQTLSNGSTYIPEIGTLALGAPQPNQTFSSNLTGQFLPSALYNNGKIPSNSFGLQIGSATMKIPGSLVLGGYDQSRILDPIIPLTSTNGTFPIALVDISIGVASGYSPFIFNGSKSGLLFDDSTAATDSNGSLPVTIDASVPYLYLPSSTCSKLASYLPIIYSPSLQLYLWNTTSPFYTPITTSPSYLAFTFGTNTSNNTIKVPFSLLSLTLTSPLTNSSDPIPYFPCQPSTLPTEGTPVWTLGRAFLQAATLISLTSSSSSIAHLIQAPGPSFPTQKIISIPTNSSSQSQSLTITPTSTSWLSTWSSHWTPLTSPLSSLYSSSTSSSSPSSSSKHSTTSQILSKAALIGLIACASITLLIISLALFWTWKRRVNVRDSSTQEEEEEEERARVLAMAKEKQMEIEQEERERQREGMGMQKKGWGWIRLNDETSIGPDGRML